MPGIRLELAPLEPFESHEEYVKRHVAPFLTELHRITTEFFVPGSTAEELAVDMSPSVPCSERFCRLDQHVDPSPKHVIFDGSRYFSLPKELVRSKQVKVQFVAVAYVKLDGTADFRLVRDDGMRIENSFFHVSGSEVQTITRILPFGDQKGSISPDSRTYYIEAGRFDTFSIPVCRRFSLSFVYI